jgi:catechol 2,3-dioxygenase-like lactoylglutathione lyase family enzyme
MSASAVGHEPKVVGKGALCVSDVPRALAFYGALGLRAVLRFPHLAIFELRGGTHLLLFHAAGAHPRGPVRSFGFVVDDAAAYRERAAAAGAEVGPVWEDVRTRHRGFEMTDPDGHVVSVQAPLDAAAAAV